MGGDGRYYLKDSSVSCEHAKEMPEVCPCPVDCYCKKHSCKPRSKGYASRAPRESLEEKLAANDPDYYLEAMHALAELHDRLYAVSEALGGLPNATDPIERLERGMKVLKLFEGYQTKTEGEIGVPGMLKRVRDLLPNAVGQELMTKGEKK